MPRHHRRGRSIDDHDDKHSPSPAKEARRRSSPCGSPKLPPALETTPERMLRTGHGAQSGLALLAAAAAAVASSASASATESDDFASIAMHARSSKPSGGGACGPTPDQCLRPLTVSEVAARCSWRRFGRSRTRIADWDQYEVSDPQKLRDSREHSNQLLQLLESSRCIVWMSNSCFLLDYNCIFNPTVSHEPLLSVEYTRANSDRRLKLVLYVADTVIDAFVHEISTTIATLASLGDLKSLGLTGCNRYGRLQNESRPFKGSTNVLDVIVRAVRAPIEEFYILKFALSSEQRRTVISRLGRGVQLRLDLSDWKSFEGIGPVINAIRSDTCPTRLHLDEADSLLPSHLNMLSNAIDENTCIEELNIPGGCWTDKRQLVGAQSFAIALSRNRCIQSLHLPAEWLVGIWINFWESVAANRTLKSIKLSYDGTPLPFDAPGGLQRNQLLSVARRLRESNATLQHLELPPNLFRDDVGFFNELVLPVLQLNRFRVVVGAIKREPDPAAREAAFALQLLQDEVRGDPSLSYLLLRSNPDLLVLCSRLRAR
jgi:hypothetical protein